jgi:hypothetical protein
VNSQNPLLSKTSPTTMPLGSAVFVETASPYSRNGLTINIPRRHRIRRRKRPLPVDGSVLPQKALCTPCTRKRRGLPAWPCFHASGNLSGARLNTTPVWLILQAEVLDATNSGLRPLMLISQLKIRIARLHCCTDFSVRPFWRFH